ncbi:MAG: hypothetical protein DMF64_17840 [Acidobacteria bacterium]|nr:MAG: hypothetical protein DMF64_17840 [Acidobacteriota bacterium]
MSTHDPAFWILVIVAAAFVIVAVAMVAIAVVVMRVARTVNRLERRAEPLLAQVTALSARVNQLATEGREVAEQVTTISDHISTATLHFSESAALIKEEVRELKQLVGYSTTTAKDKIVRVSRSIDQAQRQFSATTYFIHTKLIEPAREIAAIMAGVRRGLEVLIAPRPKPIDQTYSEEEMFIG